MRKPGFVFYLGVVVLFFSCSSTLLKADAIPKVGLFASSGAEGMRMGLAQAGINANIVDDLEPATLLQYDVVILGSAKGLAYRRWETALTLYARCGGGILLNHDATGFRGWKTPLFPNLFKGMARSTDKSAVVVQPDHPLVAGLPEKFQHAYLDHIELEQGADGLVVLNDGAGKPLAICGEAGKGRVIGCGMVIGMSEATGEGPGECAPTDGEQQFLLNAVAWLGANRLTARTSEQLAELRRELENALAIEEAAKVAAEAETDEKTARRRRTDWFAEAMLSEQGFVHPPVEMLPGRFFLFEGITVSVVSRHGVGREYGEIVGLLRQLKWLGVTDIITHTGGPLVNFRYLSKLPGISFSSYAKQYGFDYLEVLLKACHEVGLNVWGFWHPKCAEGGDGYHIQDGKGRVYAKYLDIKNPALLERCRMCLDELAERYNIYGNFKGVFLDELWHPFVYDRMEGETQRFIEFCRTRFGETPPPDLDLAAKFAMGRDWHDPENVWWRRYVLFRNTFTVDYIRTLTEYAHTKGLQMMPQVGFGFDWFQGHGDTYQLARTGDIIWSYELRNNSRYEQYPRDRVIFATHSRFHSGYQNVCLIRGGWGSQFAFEQTWQPVAGAKNPRALEVLARQIRANREWSGAKPISRIAVLTNRLGLDLAFRNAKDLFAANEETVQHALGNVWPTAMLMTQDAEYFARYKVLIAPKYSLRCIAESEYAALARYLADGGCVILLNGEISTAQPDHTKICNRTAEIAGFEPIASAGHITLANGNLKNDALPVNVPLPVFKTLTVSPITIKDADVKTLIRAAENDAPLVTEKACGAGRILAVHCDLAMLLNTPDSAAPAMDLLRMLVTRLDQPPITLKGDLLAVTAVQTGRWVAVTMLSRDASYTAGGGKAYPARGRLFVDMPALGIATNKYRVYTLARDREIMPQTAADANLWGKTYWSAEMLAEDGIPIYIPADSLQDLDLPYAGQDDYIRKYVLPRWKDSPRQFEHEIIAVAPADEACLPAPVR